MKITVRRLLNLQQEDYVKFCTQYALTHCADDIRYFDEECPAGMLLFLCSAYASFVQLGERGLRARLENVINNDFAHITYTQAIELLTEHLNNGSVLHKVITKEQKTHKGMKE